MTRLMKPPARHLTVDDPVTLTDKYGVDRTFRVRIWQGVDACAIVLATLPEGQDLNGPYVNPSTMTSKIANYVNVNMLGFPDHGFIFYEADPNVGDTVEAVYFDCFGPCLRRACLYKPTRETMKWDRLEGILQTEIKR